jgi:hypothetical protein
MYNNTCTTIRVHTYVQYQLVRGEYFFTREELSPTGIA